MGNRGVEAQWIVGSVLVEPKAFLGFRLLGVAGGDFGFARRRRSTRLRCSSRPDLDNFSIAEVSARLGGRGMTPKLRPYA